MTIGVKDEQKGDDKVPVRAIVDKERQIDLLKLHKYCGSIGANENWSSIAQKMNFLLTAQKAVDLCEPLLIVPAVTLEGDRCALAGMGEEQFQRSIFRGSRGSSVRFARIRRIDAEEDSCCCSHSN